MPDEMAYGLVAATDEPDGRALLEWLLLRAYAATLATVLSQEWATQQQEQMQQRGVR